MAERKKSIEQGAASSAVQTRELPQVEIVGRQAVTTSMAIANFFGKSHKHVLEAIRATVAECPADFNGPNFRPVEYVDAKGERRPCYQLTRNAFSLVAMGFTGKKAMEWKIAYIKAFEAMENALRQKAKAAPGAVNSPYVFEGIPIRARIIDGQPWVSVRDMSKALGVAFVPGAKDALYHIRPEWTRTEKEQSGGYAYRLKYFALPAVVQFCTRCRAERQARSLSFLRWLVDDVFHRLTELPSMAMRRLTA